VSGGRQLSDPPAWKVVAVFAVAPLDHFTMGTHAVVAATPGEPSFRLYAGVGDYNYTPEDILRGNLPKGVTVLWKGGERMAEPEGATATPSTGRV